MTTDAQRTGRRLRFAAGWLLAVLLLSGLAEAFLRHFPPRDLHPYLGEESPLAGPFRPDPLLGVAYRSWDSFHTDYRDRLSLYLPFTTSKPVWAFFGNSFVQAPDMLADTARAQLPGCCIFNLARNELLPVRFAQVPLLLEKGLRPERIFFNLMPVDVVPLGEQPLKSIHVTARGALTYTPRPPLWPFAALPTHSRVALAAWVRSGRHRGNPSFNRHRIYQGLPPPLAADLEQLFGQLALTARAHSIPVTVMLLPAWHQVTRGASFGFQDDLTAILRRQGLDVFDPRDSFTSHPDRENLFIPDKHFNGTGNQVLLDALRAHLRSRTGQDFAQGARP